MYTMNNRTLKDLLYEQVARVGKALASPKRLEMLEMLAQGEKSVEAVAEAVAVDIKLASAHLKALKEARLVQSRRDGKRMLYRLSGQDVAQLGVTLRQVAEEHLVELRLAVQQMMAEPERLAKVGRKELMAQAKRGEVVVLDVRLLRNTRPRICPMRAPCRWPNWRIGCPNCRATWRSSPTAAARSA